jgi:hypothetical protein
MRVRQGWKKLGATAAAVVMVATTAAAVSAKTTVRLTFDYPVGE